MEETKKLQEQKAITIVKELLSHADARSLRDDLNQIFYGYISSEEADSKRERNIKGGTYMSLVNFLTKISNLDTINRWTD